MNIKEICCLSFYRLSGPADGYVWQHSSSKRNSFIENIVQALSILRNWFFIEIFLRKSDIY